ncbi:MAG: hypothetical protein PWP55_246 [Clostridiales bacterium]|jgi:predicted HD superfamily hydrolase involved in NAD metabolism|nr:hypothetical protein [Clostridiales bacterium]
MMELEYIEQKIKEMLTPCRFEHSLGVREAAVHLANIYAADCDKAALAGLVHDCAKDLNYQQMKALVTKYDMELDDVSSHEPALIHGPLGAHMARDMFDINDEEVLNAIRYHTTGRSGMGLLEQIVYLADYIEPNRDFPGVNELREVSERDLDRALLMALDNTIIRVISRKRLLHPNTIFARNDFIMHLSQKE